MLKPLHPELDEEPGAFCVFVSIDENARLHRGELTKATYHLRHLRIRVGYEKEKRWLPLLHVGVSERRVAT